MKENWVRIVTPVTDPELAEAGEDAELWATAAGAWIA